MGAPRFIRDLAALIGAGRAADSFSAAPSSFAPIVLGGCGRSGTTLLRLMLDSHRRICCGPESSLFRRRAIDTRWLADRFGFSRDEVRAIYDAAASRPAFIVAFAALCMQKAGKARWAEKTPRNIGRVADIFRCFPEARFVHVLRDGRDVACSLRTHPRHRVIEGKLVPTGIRRPIAGCARRWVRDIEGSRRWWGDPRFMTVRYEDLVLDPRPALGHLMTFIGEAWDEAMLAHSSADSPFRDATRFAQNPEALGAVSTAALGRWQRDLDERDKRIFRRIAGPLLVELGYAKDDGW
ncbi:MAG TPA: sulfotransferase [Steroidobacteraceae bacterium]|nr:sulfotransferase [Steroidobacteraceae bacterium]